MAEDERRPREPPYWYAQDDVARARADGLDRRLDGVERRVVEIEHRADDLGGKLEGLATAEANRKRRGDDLTGIGKVLALLATIGGAVLAYLSYAHH